MNSAIHVVVANPDNIARFGIRSLLATHKEIDLVGETAEYGQIYLLCKHLSPDLLLVSASAPSAALLQTIDKLRHENPPVFTIVLASSYQEGIVRAFIQAGIAGYIASSDPINSLLHAIRAVMAGGTWFSQSIMNQITQVKAHYRAHPIFADPLVDLTQRELEVLQLMGHGQTNQQIGLALGITERTIRFHIRNIFDKLNFKTRGEAIAWAIRDGFSQ
jgi:DNA-binding NarL/FixJ family response regulator